MNSGKGDEKIEIPLKSAEATHNRDALAKVREGEAGWRRKDGSSYFWFVCDNYFVRVRAVVWFFIIGFQFTRDLAIFLVATFFLPISFSQNFTHFAGPVFEYVRSFGQQD
jgi:hypothetical protein